MNLGAVNDQGNVDLDTGAVLCDANLVSALFSLISDHGEVNEKNIRCSSMNSQELVFMGIFYILLRQIPHWNSIIMSSRKELTAKS